MITTKPLISPGLPEYILSPPATTFVEDPIATIERRMTKIDRAHLDCVAVRIGVMLIIGMALYEYSRMVSALGTAQKGGE
jgi:hypothetical protein